MALKKVENISLKDNKEINEAAIQKFIFEDPSCLGLGDLEPAEREKIQPSGGRLDILLQNEVSNTRYEVEVQLGQTDPSHIIRTIEYWDNERRRFPKWNHIAVIVAENITGRFNNVIQLFNRNIPIIALQMSAYKNGNDISLAFTKVLDQREWGEEEEDKDTEPADRNYWEQRSTTKMLKVFDEIFKNLGEIVSNYEVKYNKYYIGLSKSGRARNFVWFKPKKNFIYICTKSNELTEITNDIDKADIEISYRPQWREYYIRLRNFEEFKKNKELIEKIIKKSKNEYGETEND